MAVEKRCFPYPCVFPQICLIFYKRYAEIFSSVRGNLPMNYRLDYGYRGTFLAYFHLTLLRYFDHVSVMSFCYGKTGFLLVPESHYWWVISLMKSLSINTGKIMHERRSSNSFL